MRKTSTKELRNTLALNKCQFKELPTAFQFGFNSISLLFYWNRKGKGASPNLLAMGSSISDTSGAIFTDDFELLKATSLDSQKYFVPESAFLYNESLGSPIQLEKLIGLLIDPREEIQYPVVGFNSLKNFSTLRTLTSNILGKDHELTQKLESFHKSMGGIIDISKILLKLEISNTRNIDYIEALQLLPLSEYIAAHPCLETQVVRETFNYALQCGISKGKFIDFSSMVSWLNSPCIITHMLFGKHEGIPLPKMPKSYVNYLLEQPWMFEDEHQDLLYSLRNLDLVQNALEAAK
ncbi:hypothetical protein [Ewingella americana]|uniref:Uncharacterized protein n=1 Tax=Ewingella americana TaxID=41202 RepID=A0A502GDS4_9GAMM|nr:hypothetical protein [Ewingella americana]TPG60014.1 hypothetical protein EAH77_15720 [Ewingella americana]